MPPSQLSTVIKSGALSIPRSRISANNSSSQPYAPTTILKPTGKPFETPSGPAESQLASANYEDEVRELVRGAAKDEIPPGYTKDPAWNGTRLQVGTVVGEPSMRLVGNQLAVEYFTLKNIGATSVELVEPNFSQKGVRAIAFINHVQIAPGQATRMVWVRDR